MSHQDDPTISGDPSIEDIQDYASDLLSGLQDDLIDNGLSLKDSLKVILSFVAQEASDHQIPLQDLLSELL